MRPLARSWSAAVCVASGQSFTEQQAASIAAAREGGAFRLVVVNDNWRRLPKADVLYAPDTLWWKLYHAEVARGFGGECWTTQDLATAEAYGLHWIESVETSRPLPNGSDKIARGSNGGLQALMLARLFGAKRILLVGYDMHGRHWFGDHPKILGQADPRQWIARFEEAAPLLAAEGTEVVNCSPGSALACFRRGELGAELAELACCT